MKYYIIIFVNGCRKPMVLGQRLIEKILYDLVVHFIASSSSCYTPLYLYVYIYI